MKLKLVCVFTVLCNWQVAFGGSGIVKAWDNEVYSGRQFDDYITQTKVASPMVMTPAVLVLYKPSCERVLNMEKLGDNRLPPNQYMVMAKHDYETFPKYIWYEHDARDDLKSRYNPQKCPEYIYFKNGTDHHKETERYDKSSGSNVFYWIWDKFSVEFKVINERDSRIVIEFHGRGPKISSYTIEAGADMVLEGYVSYFVLISDAVKQTFLHGFEIKPNSNEQIVVLQPTSRMDEKAEQWFNGVRAEQDNKHMSVRGWRWGVTDIYLHDFKQPVLLPKFTDLGYKKGTMPVDLYRDLLGFYQSNIKKRKSEEHHVEPAINDSEVKCSMVFLTPELIEKTGRLMKPLMEEWANVTLVQTRMYGIREYYRGNLLRNHVDRVTTHVVSVILQIDQDLEGEPDWELEVIGFDGMRKNVTLLPGEMLFYESATLIHGRPFPYKGRIFANAFLHYKPVHGWGWALSKDLQHYVYDNKKVENIIHFDSPNMYKTTPNLDRFEERKDYNVQHDHSHDEL